MIDLKNFGEYDKAYLSNGEKTYELDLITLQIKETDKTINGKILFDKSDKSRTNDIIAIHEYMDNQSECAYQNRKVEGLIIIPTWGCKAKCSYCYAASHKKDPTMLTKDKIDNVVKRYNIVPENIKSTIYIGGEPLENFDAIKYSVKLFKNAEHTICTAFVADDDILDELLRYVMFNENVDISLSIDLPSSLRYKADKENKNPLHSHERNLYWFKKFYGLIGNRIRIKTTANVGAYEVNKLRNLLPDGAQVYCDGAGYGFGDIKLIPEHAYKGIIKEWEDEAERVINGERSFKDSFFKYGPYVHRYFKNKVAKTCNCGKGYFTIEPEGNLTYCDNPGKPTLDEETIDHPQMYEDIKINGKCATCPYIKLCGGGCYVKDRYQLFCFVNVIDFVYSTYVDLFKEDKERL